MKLGIGFPHNQLTAENLRYAAQLGVTHVIVHNPKFGEHGYHEVDQLKSAKDLIESFGLTWEGIENLPRDHWEQVLLAGKGRDAQMANITRTLENMASVGIPILGYYFGIAGVVGHWRSYDGGGRGGAGIKSFDVDRIPDNSTHESGAVSVDEMWKRFEWFLDHAIPVAERVGIRLAAHQDDPPMAMLKGTGRLLTSHESMQRLIDYAPSPCNGLEFCQGTVSEMGTDTVIDAIRRFAGQGKIFYVHFRNIIGQFPKFDEVFLDEGDVDPHEAMVAYHEAGFEGVMTPDHCPIIEGETDYRHRGMAFSLGYMRSLMQVVEKQSEKD
jgi:mannonate dehydratase